MPEWMRAMWAPTSEPLTPLSRYTVANGLFYMAYGLTGLCFPQVTELMGGPPLGDDVGYIRLLAFTVAVIGWFYVMGGRTNRETFGLATVADRVVVPFVMGWLVLVGDVQLMTVLPLMIIDPVLAFGAWWIWSKEQPAG